MKVDPYNGFEDIIITLIFNFQLKKIAEIKA